MLAAALAPRHPQAQRVRSPVIAAAIWGTVDLLALAGVHGTGVSSTSGNLTAEVFHTGTAGVDEEPALLALPLALGARVRWPRWAVSDCSWRCDFLPRLLPLAGLVRGPMDRRRAGAGALALALVSGALAVRRRSRPVRRAAIPAHLDERGVASLATAASYRRLPRPRRGSPVGALAGWGGRAAGSRRAAHFSWHDSRESEAVSGRTSRASNPTRPRPPAIVGMPPPSVVRAARSDVSGMAW